LLPVLFILSLEFAGVAASAFASHRGWDAGVVVVALVYLVIFALDMAAVIWAGSGLDYVQKGKPGAPGLLWVLIGDRLHAVLVFRSASLHWVADILDDLARKLQSDFRNAAQRYTFSAPNTHSRHGEYGMPPRRYRDRLPSPCRGHRHRRPGSARKLLRFWRGGK